MKKQKEAQKVVTSRSIAKSSRKIAEVAEKC